MFHAQQQPFCHIASSRMKEKHLEQTEALVKTLVKNNFSGRLIRYSFSWEE